MNTSQNSPTASPKNKPHMPSQKRGLTKKNTLRSRLLTTLLPAVVVPLVFAGLIGEQVAEKRFKKNIISGLEADTLLAHNATATFLRNSFDITNTIALEPELIELMRAANQLVDEQKLASQPIAVLENQFASPKFLQVDTKLNTDVNNYFRRIVRAGSVAEVVATQRDGFNIGYSSPTSDFVQSDEKWWQTAKDEIKVFGNPTFDQSTDQQIIPFSKAIYDPQSGKFIGIVKVAISVGQLEDDIDAYLYGENKEGYKFQIVDAERDAIFDDIEPTRSKDENIESEALQAVDFVGGEAILNAAKILLSLNDESLSLSEAERQLNEQSGFSQIQFKTIKSFDKEEIEMLLKYENRLFSFAAVPDTNLVSVGSVDYSIITKEGRDILLTYAVTTIVLIILTTVVILLLSKQISLPLTNLAKTTRKVAEGDYDIVAKREGTDETVFLADNFNQLISEVKTSLDSQRALNEQQRQEKEELEASIYTLIDEIADATDGDLTVRANLDSVELSTVADLFNAIIDSLQDIAIEAKESSGKVGSSLKKNEEAIRSLAEQAIEETKETRKTLVSIDEMTNSIRSVAKNASQAEKITEGTYSTVLNSTLDMEETVNSILKLRSTVGETSKKMKRLGESSQKISQAVSLIEEIALKTNVLAINASVEAGRAGEYGEGFTIVAEQVGALAEQSAKATREITDIVSTIQLETQEVNQAMESGTAEVVETTRLIETTKQSLGAVLEKSQEINRLMGSISESTVSQANTSQDVANLIQKIAELSENTSKSSENVAKSIVETAQIAKNLESTVSQFKVAT